MTPLMFVAGLLLLLCCALLGFVIVKRGAFRFQFSLRTLFVAVTVIAAALGVMIAWPRHLATFHVPRIIDAKPGTIDCTQDAFEMDISSRRWRGATIQLVPRHGFDPASRVELLWLDGGKLRHVAISDAGSVPASAISFPNEWPIAFAVIEYHPKATNVFARWIAASGRAGGWNAVHNVGDPQFSGDIEKWGKSYLEKILKARQDDSGGLAF